MTHQNHQTNGASLEDCHTNFFALTELYGIKWRKLVWGENGVGEDDGAALADPVISSYARCLAGDILCVWRRVPSQPQDIYDMSTPAPPPLSLRAAKELWIFWYGEEPDLNGLVAPELIASQGDQGSWESGLSYECRSLLFKALHNLIERCLLSRDFVRLGKWFVQPYDGDDEDVGKSPWHLSFSFAFFLHGESTVCASVDVRQHPPVRTVTAKRLHSLARPKPAATAAAAAAQTHGTHADDNKVILAPFGLEAVVTGRVWTDRDGPTARLLDGWRQLYPLEHGCHATEVVCGGVRMRYPLPYVVWPAGAEGPAGAPHRPRRPPAAPLPGRTLAALTTPSPTHYSAESDEKDDFVDPTRKTTCTCAKWRRRRPTRAPRPPPFHRRRPRDPRDPRDPAAPGPPPNAQPHRLRQSGCAAAAASSPGSCGGGSPAPSAPPSAGPPPPSPHAAHTTQPGGQPGACAAPTPDPLAPPTPTAAPAPAPASASANAKLYSHGDSPCGAPPPSQAAAGGAAAGPAGPAGLPGRPSLPASSPTVDPMEDEHCLTMLYDYTTVHAWLEHPVKRFKSEASPPWEPLARGPVAGADLYAGHDHTRLAALGSLRLGRDAHDAHEDVKEYKNLFTSDGLCPTFRDLDQIFDNSDDASGDETAVSTPPECALLGGGGGRCVRAEELSKMFPTPPSLEPHAQASPSPGCPAAPDDCPALACLPLSTALSHSLPHSHAHSHSLHAHAHATGGSARPHVLSPPPDPIEDWSYVFKPPTVYKYVGSSKYAPLPTLPSQLLPPVALPAGAVYRPRWQERAGTERDGKKDAPRTNCIKRSGSPLGSGSPAPAPAPAAAPPPRPRGGSAGPPPRRSPAPAPAPPPRAACPLLLNVLLADTVLNVFRDHNFDSCSLCVCNAGPRVVGNILGADAAPYLSGLGLCGSEEPPRCSCGFSAIVNRRRAHQAGLFYEDEMEITGVAEEPGGGGGGGLCGAAVAAVLAACSGPVWPRHEALARAAAEAATAASEPAPTHSAHLNLLEYSDGGLAASLALRSASGCLPSRSPARSRSPPRPVSPVVHRWPFLAAAVPRSTRDVVRLMRRLRPLLQDAIQKRCHGARMWDSGVSGPLTWRQFHRLAGRGNEDPCEPQPVPPLLVGHERDWLSLAPHALKHWERLALEPYAVARDVAYVVLAPHAEHLTAPLKAFFRELSTSYEACRLGRHAPLTRVARDHGLLRAGPPPHAHAASPQLGGAGADEWTGPVKGKLGRWLRAYSEALRSSLVPALSALSLDRALLGDRGERERERERARGGAPPAPAPTPAPPTPDHPHTPSSQSDDDANTNNSSLPSSGVAGSCGGGGVGAGAGGGGPWEGEERGPPALVLYLVEPPLPAPLRTAALAPLLRLAARAAQQLQHHSPLVKIISLESVCESWGLGCSAPLPSAPGSAPAPAGSGASLRALAFSVFSGARRLLAHRPDGKSLTGFGPAANANLFLQTKDEKNRAPYRLFSPAWVLAPPRALKEVAETWGQGGGGGATGGAGGGAGGGGGVLFVSYCLSHDQRWLLAAASDARGELIDTAAINIHVPARSRRRVSAGARRLGLTKLMDWMLGVMSQAAQPWRLVVGRVGRIGHGELKGWSWLLSRKNLMRASTVLKEICNSCSVLYPTTAARDPKAVMVLPVPCILSACLVSTEPDGALRLMADRFTPDERFSQASIHSQLHTPRDVTATHILVFPTSATTQSNQMPFEQPMANGENDDMNSLFGMDMGDEDMGEDNIGDLFIGDMFTNMWAPGSPRGSPRRPDPDADPDGDPDGEPEDDASRDGAGSASPNAQRRARRPRHSAAADHDAEAVGAVLQQPLALGYLVSTAPLPPMPRWWWAGAGASAHGAGAHGGHEGPAFLRSALHLHAGSVLSPDDYLTLTHRRDHNTHPLDSQTTTDVLRYVLEGYNALSWLALDNTTHDRASCLPLHVQVLMQLYHTAAALG